MNSADELEELRRQLDAAVAAVKAVTSRQADEKKQLEARLVLADKLASLGLLAASVAHEINNPLAFVVGNLSFIERKLPGLLCRTAADSSCVDELMRAVREAQEGAERVRSIVRDLKTVSRSDDDQDGAVDIHQVLNSTAHMAGHVIRQRAQLVKQYAASQILVQGNEARLGQVFLNLIVNAAQAIDEGSASRNEIRLSTWVSNDGRIVAEVRDTGQGMSPEVQARLFTPFFTTKPKGVGTGLGMSICHSIVTSHGGEIQVESELGKGTAVRVFLPAGKKQLEEARGAAPSLQSRKGPVGRILVVDDEPLVAAALQRVLASHHQTIIAGDGPEALQKIALDPNFDVVFCDLMMPEMPGNEIYDAVARTQPELAKRIVFLTGGAFTDSARAFLSSVANVTVEKPFEAAEVLAIAAQFVGRNHEP